MKLSSTAAILTELIYEAGKIMLSAHNDEQSQAVKIKPGMANFVTAYDVAVQEFLLREIAAAIPDATFIAEEQENDPKAFLGDKCFVIDPIDGTTNFIHDYRHSSISVAMLTGGEPVFGAVYDPYLGEMFTAERGHGAYLNGRPIHVANTPVALSVVTLGSTPYDKNTYASRTFALAQSIFMETADFRRSASAALDLAYVAAGRIDGFFELQLSPWDFAAGSLLVTEAGGLITQEDGTPITLSAPCSIFAGSPQVHPFLILKAIGC